MVKCMNTEDERGIVKFFVLLVLTLGLATILVVSAGISLVSGSHNQLAVTLVSLVVVLLLIASLIVEGVKF